MLTVRGSAAIASPLSDAAGQPARGLPPGAAVIIAAGAVVLLAAVALVVLALRRRGIWV